MNILGFIIGALGLIITGASAVFSYFEYQKRIKIEEVFKTNMKSFPGQIAIIERNCKWANTNTRGAIDALNQIPESEHKQNVMRLLGLSSGNTMASKELCLTVFNNILTFQQTQFGTREIIFTGSDELELCQKEKAVK
jgi:hypothetical protein